MDNEKFKAFMDGLKFKSFTTKEQSQELLKFIDKDFCADMYTKDDVTGVVDDSTPNFTLSALLYYLEYCCCNFKLTYDSHEYCCSIPLEINYLDSNSYWLDLRSKDAIDACCNAIIMYHKMKELYQKLED